MAYTDGDSLAVRIRIAFGANVLADPGTWAWTDVTSWWHVPDDVEIGWGRSSGADQAETSTLSLTLKNTDGRFTAYDPRSPYWPHVKKWTPISYDIDLGDGVGWRNRFSGYIRKWPLTWPAGTPLMALAEIEAVGILGRIGRGKPPALSPLRRSIGASNPLAYWPVEDGATSGQAASALSGHPPLTITGSVEFGTVEDFALSSSVTVRYGTSALANLSGGRLDANLPAAATTASASGWTASVAAGVDITTAAADVVLIEVTTPGATYERWQLVANKTDFKLKVIAYTAAGAATTVVADPGASIPGPFYLFDFSIWQSAPGTISAGIGWNHATDAHTYGTGTVAGTLTGATHISANTTPTTSTTELPFGHLVLWAGWPTPMVNNLGTYSSAYQSWRQELATTRLARLCAEDGIPLDMPAVAAEDTSRMGWQTVQTSPALYAECEAADLGLLYESGFGLGYLPRSERYNPPVSLTLDAAAGQLGMPFEPVDDDQLLRNRWTVSRSTGSMAVAADDESIEQQGEIEGSITLNLADDSGLADHAGIRLHLSTVAEPRYPALSINLAAHRELAAAWCDCLPGSRMQVVNPPTQNVPGTVDQLIVGAREVYRGRRSWRATLNVVPASPWTAFVLDDAELGRLDTAGMELATDATASATSLSVTTTSGPLATTDPAEYPVDVELSTGEIVTITAAVGAANPQTLTVTRAVNGVSKPAPAGTTVRLASKHVITM